MCGRGWVCEGANIIVSLFVCVHLCVFLFPCHTRKGALMLYTLYVEHTMGEVEAIMGRRSSRWSP